MTMNSFSDYGINLPDNFTGERSTTCPQCSSTRKKKSTPCLRVNGDKGVWKCQHCGWAGSLGGHNPNKREEVEYLKPIIDDKPQLSSDVAKWFKTNRNIGLGALLSAKVFSCFKYLRATGEDTLCMAFPYYKEGELVNVKYRDANKNMTQEKSPEPSCFNLDSIKGAADIFITEGEIDTLSLIEAGFKSAVSVDKGAPQAKDNSADKKLECISLNMSYFEGAKRIYLVTDKDEPGLRLERELVKIFGASKCYLVKYPQECKDINDVLVRFGIEGVQEAVNSASPCPISGLVSVGSQKDKLLSYWKQGVLKGLSTGFVNLDDVFTLQMGSVNVVTGIPQSGKSEFVHQILINAMVNHKLHAVVFSPEMLPSENLVANFAEKYTNKPFFGKNRMDYRDVNSAVDYLDKHLHMIIPPADETPSLEELLTTAQVCVDRYGAKLFVIDPYNEIQHTRDAFVTETDYISKFMSRLRTFARQNKVWVCLVAHPTKLKKEPNGNFPVPTMYDIAGSANFYNKTDNGISLWRDIKAKNNLVQVHIQKIKNKNIGRAGEIVTFEWQRGSGTFKEYREVRGYEEPPNK